MQQIYTIPVHEALEKGAADPKCGCPMCRLFCKLENDELDLILGASMMEPDTRIQTNKKGFCRTHYDMMFVRKNRLGMALTLESHLDELAADIKAGAIDKLLGKPDAKAQKRITGLEHSCYVCDRIDFHFQHMAETVALLYDADDELGTFDKKLRAQPYFCLPHYRLLLEKGAARLPKKKMAAYTETLSSVVEAYMTSLREDVSWFCKKFDYRYENEPWGNAKDSVERAMAFLRCDLHKG